MSGEPPGVSPEMRVEWDRQISIVEQCQDKLTPWELKFLNSVRSWRTLGVDLTLKQSGKLREIFNRRTG